MKDQQSSALPSQQSDNEQRRKITGELHVRGEIEASIPAGVIEAYRSARKENTSRDNWRFLVEVLTLVTVLVYASLTAWQAETTQTIANLTRNQFEADERPYILFAPSERHGFRQDGHFFVDMFPVNYGKSPAIRARSEQKMFIGPDAMSQASEWFSALGSVQFPSDSNHPEGMIAPGISPPQEGNWKSFVSDEAVSPKLINDLLSSQDHGVVIVYRVQYMSLSGNPYQTDVCFAFIKGGAFGQCPNHNDLR